jgi:hypothetical protein
VHTLVSAIILYKSCAVATPKHLNPFLPKNYVRIVAFAPNLQRAFFYSRTVFLPYSTTVKLLLLLILIIGSNLSLRTALRCLEVIAGFVSAVARKFMQGCHPDRYLQPERLPIPASAKQPHNHHSVIYLQWLPRLWLSCLWLCSLGKRTDPSPGAFAIQLNLGHASSQPTHLLLEFATSQGCGRCGSAALPASAGEVSVALFSGKDRTASETSRRY